MGGSLIHEAQLGDRRAFEELVAESIDRLYSTAILILGDRTMAEDAVQEALVRAWRGIPRLRDVDRYGAWLHRVLVNACLDVSKRTRMPAVRLESSAFPDERGSFESAVDTRDEVSRALARLNCRERVVLVLRFFVGLSVPELAHALNVPLGTAKSRLHHALGAMRAAVDADGRVATQGGWA